MKRIIYILFLIAAAMCLCSCSAEKTPIYADSINDGTYSIDVESSSSMFRIIDCRLTAENGKMTADITLSGTGYEKLFLGTKEEAANGAESDFFYFSETDDGKYSYTIPAEALDKEFPCAAFSTRKQEWYDRTLVFISETLPSGALKFNPVPVIIISAAALIVISAAVIIIIRCVKKRGK